MRDNNKPLGFQYNDAYSDLVDLVNKKRKVEESINRQLDLDEKSLSTANSKIEETNRQNIRFQQALLDAWTSVFNFLKSFDDAVVRSRKNELDKVQDRIKKNKSESNSLFPRIERCRKALNAFKKARDRWESETLSSSATSLASWAVAARVKVVVSLTNSVICFGHDHPGIEFVKEKKVSPGLYGLFYKIAHPVKYDCGKQRLESAPTFWAQYVNATARLEEASSALGVPFVLGDSELTDIAAPLRKEIQAQEGDLKRVLTRCVYAIIYNRIVQSVNNVDGLISSENLSEILKDQDIRNTFCKTLGLRLNAGEVEYVLKTSVYPSYYKEKRKVAYEESPEVNKLREEFSDIDRKLKEAEDRVKALQKSIQEVSPLFVTLHQSLFINPIGVDSYFPDVPNRSLPCIIGATDRNYRERFVPWQSGKSEDRYNYNLRPEDNDYNTEVLSAVLNTAISPIIAAFKPGTLKVTFVDLEMKGLQGTLFKPLIERGLATAITSSRKLEEKVEEFQNKLECIYNSPVGGTNIYEAYNSGKVKPDYELMVIFGPEKFNCSDNLKSLIKRGPDYGISIFGVALSEGQSETVHDPVSKYLTNLYINPDVLLNNSSILKELKELFNEIAESYKNNLEESIHWSEINTLIQAFSGKLKDKEKKIWKDATKGLSVPVGMRANQELDYYHFSPEDGQHLSLVIGSTGSGKSVFLHNIITNLILSYSPAQVHLHLMDFKSTGLEFKEYKGAPHVRTLLLDGGDLDMAAAILRSLKGEIAIISSKLGDCKNIKEYNEKHKDDPIPFNILIVDECQELFRINDSAPRAVDEIREIISYIAKQGRASGFGFIFATQTRRNLRFPADAEAQLNNVFMLKCAEDDAFALFPHDKIEVPRFHVYHKTPNNETALTKVFDNRSDSADKKLYTRIIREQHSFESKDQFCFTSTYMRPLTLQIVKEDNERRDHSSPVLSLGHKPDVKYTPVPVELTFSLRNSNLLMAGINNEGQMDRIMYNWMYGLSLYNPSQSKVYVLNGNPSSDSAQLKQLVERFGESGNCEFHMGHTIPESREKIAEVYKEYRRRKGIGRMGDEKIKYQPIVIAVFNNDSLIPSLDKDDKFKVDIKQTEVLDRKVSDPLQSELKGMNQEEANLYSTLKKLGGNSDQSKPFSFNKIDALNNLRDTTDRNTQSEEVSYGVAYAQLLADGGFYHIHFVIQKGSENSQIVPEYAIQDLRTRETDMFNSVIKVVPNNMATERTNGLLDTNMAHLRVYFKESSVGEAFVMAPYVIPND